MKFRWVILFVSFLSGHAFADSECDDLRAKIFDSPAAGNAPSAVIEKLQQQADTGSLCAKNIIGRMFSQGHLVETDHERAYAIFYDLAEQKYPPGQYNFAYVLSKRSDVDPSVVLAYLQGLISSYTADPTYGRLASRATDLGRNYLVDLRAKGGAASELEEVFESVVRRSNYDAAVALVNKTKQRRETEDSIMDFVALGVAVGQLSSTVRGASANGGFGGNAVPAPAWMNYKGIIGPSSLYRAPAWRSYSGIIGPNILYKIR